MFSPGIRCRTFFRHRPELSDLPLAAPAPSRLAVLGSPEQRFVADAWNAFGGLLGPLSRELTLDPALCVAVLCVESSGRGFAPDGRLVIRFECHNFWQRWGRSVPAKETVFREHFRFDSQRKWEGHQFRANANEDWRPVHVNQETEWQALSLARGLADTEALCSTSMGSAQLMGYHHARIGFPTVQEMFTAFADRETGERAQILALFDFLRGAGGDSRMLDALRRQDFLAFARAYNGPGRAAAYAERIARLAQVFLGGQRLFVAGAG